MQNEPFGVTTTLVVLSVDAVLGIAALVGIVVAEPSHCESILMYDFDTRDVALNFSQLALSTIALFVCEVWFRRVTFCPDPPPPNTVLATTSLVRDDSTAAAAKPPAQHEPGNALLWYIPLLSAWSVWLWLFDFQLALCLLAACTGVSVVWASCAGYIGCVLSLMHREWHWYLVAVLLFGVVLPVMLVGYYMESYETTVAHLCAIVLGVFLVPVQSCLVARRCVCSRGSPAEFDSYSFTEAPA
eukprot:gnl/Spiro4/11345_TR5987_c0_g1_i1.p2 gnl/Spiro4/11345_TR5987_c0_g1~~gnl/Spiro4/11345_TR5987_c0_g1_i1.p2  ORF type:complete len:243 (+),score=74.58 gnl/Spiro4/11345_TR5987_c0_g1_i1:72-800(+)